MLLRAAGGAAAVVVNGLAGWLGYGMNYSLKEIDEDKTRSNSLSNSLNHATLIKYWEEERKE